MELRHLRYFLAVAEEGQFTRAADRLAMQQPPLSQQIRVLEEEVGFDLFVRLPRGITLTPAGEAFADDIRMLFEMLQHAIGKASRIARGELGTIAIGLTSSAGIHPLTSAVIRAFRKLCPEVAVEPAEFNAAEIVERLANGQLQVAFLRKPVATRDDLVYELLQDEPMVVVLPVGHVLLEHAGKRPPQIPLKALANENFILVRRPGAPGMYADILDACRLAGFAPQVAREVPRMAAGINLVAAGLGVTLVPASMQQYAHAGTVYCALKPPTKLQAPLHLAYPAELHNAAARRFIDLALERARES
ncbi:LysR family transcriptional regulator [Burkholderia sp. WAC0059]|uniref:LysR family transcriptional regulator n=1 Tax=Burkholderia sp. WAC0059 TaxID=2066022 RepID=UPI000C7F272C|nr:LysR family transcriptional regulator [Burkholderia sp. WAC0059]PLZ00022.1 LysR family transcriptional regulator [Burkholderia sp. WAC0059]